MHLTPRDIDKLVLHQAGFLAQKRLARGIRLNYVETVALIATQLLEFIRDGQSVASLMDLGRRLLGTKDVLEQVDTRLSTLEQDIRSLDAKVDARFDRVDTRFDQESTRVNARFDRVDARIDWAG